MSDQTSPKPLAKPLANIHEVSPFDMPGAPDGFGARLAPMGALIGARDLGCMLTIVEPGKAAFPYHVHHHNEEMFFILEGEGTYRFGTERHDVKAGDLLAAPVGGPEVAHQIINTGDKILKYLGFSTKKEPEVVEYPDTGKFAMFSQSSGSGPMSARVRYIGRQENSLDYWEGETNPATTGRRPVTPSG